MSSATLPSGQSEARYSTSAAVAETEASSTELSNDVQQNATQFHEAAADAAHSAEAKESKTASAVDQLEHELSDQTNVAVSEGAADVQSAKAAAGGYIEQAINIAESVLATAQSYITGSQPKTESTAQSTSASTESGGVGTAVHSAVETGKEYLASAQAAAKPYVDSATGIAATQAEKVKSTVSGTTSGKSVAGKPSEVPPSTAPLESGPHVVDSPYPEQATEQPKKVAEL